MAECPNCGEAAHSIVRGRSSSESTLDAVVRCHECGQAHHATLRQPSDRTVRLIISEGRTTRRTTVDLPSDEVVKVRDEFFAGREYIQVRSIESGDKRVNSAPASEIDTIWARSFDQVKVPITVHRTDRSMRRQVIVPPDEEFAVGDVMEVKHLRFALHKIMCEGGRSARVAQAREIVRLYGKQIKGGS